MAAPQRAQRELVERPMGQAAVLLTLRDNDKDEREHDPRLHHALPNRIELLDRRALLPLLCAMPWRLGAA